MSNPRPPHGGDAQTSPGASDGRGPSPGGAVRGGAPSDAVGAGSDASDDALAGLVYGRSSPPTIGSSGGVATMAPGVHGRVASAATPFDSGVRPSEAVRAQAPGYPAASEAGRGSTVSRPDKPRVFYPDDPVQTRQTTSSMGSSAESAGSSQGSLPPRNASAGPSPGYASQVAPATRPWSPPAAGPSHSAAGSPVPPSGQDPRPAWVLPPRRVEQSSDESSAVASAPLPVMASAAQNPPTVALNERRWSPPSQEMPAQLMGQTAVPRNRTPDGLAPAPAPTGGGPGAPQLPSSRQIFTPPYSAAVGSPLGATPTSSPPGRLPAQASGFGMSVRTPAPSSRPSISADEAYRAASQQHPSQASEPSAAAVTDDFWTSGAPTVNRPAPSQRAPEASYVYGPSASSLPRSSQETAGQGQQPPSGSPSNVWAAGHPATSPGSMASANAPARGLPPTPSASSTGYAALPSSAELFQAFGPTLAAVGPESPRPSSQGAIPVVPPATWETRRPGSQGAIPVVPPATWETRRPGSQGAIPVVPPAYVTGLWTHTGCGTHSARCDAWPCRRCAGSGTACEPSRRTGNICLSAGRHAESSGSRTDRCGPGHHAHGFARCNESCTRHRTANSCSCICDTRLQHPQAPGPWRHGRGVSCGTAERGGSCRTLCGQDDSVRVGHRSHDASAVPR